MHKKILYYWGPAVFLMILIFILSSFSKLPTPEIIVGFDKIAHFVVYMVLSLLFYRAFLGTTEYTEKKIMIIAVLLASLYGLTDEFHQSFVPGRDTSIYDLIANIIGAFSAYTIFFKKLREVIIRDCRM